jgi:hypothetical protein
MLILRYLRQDAARVNPWPAPTAQHVPSSRLGLGAALADLPAVNRSEPRPAPILHPATMARWPVCRGGYIAGIGQL